LFANAYSRIFKIDPTTGAILTSFLSSYYMKSLEISPDGIFIIGGSGRGNNAIIYNVNVASDLITYQKEINGNAGASLYLNQITFISYSKILGLFNTQDSLSI
jgi:hypothetical protein